MTDDRTTDKLPGLEREIDMAGTNHDMDENQLKISENNATKAESATVKHKDIAYFISDIHLSEKHQDSWQLFSKFMHQYAANAKSLYILGDLFDYWIGDDDRSLFNDQVITLIKSTVDLGTKVYFMPGNRDFLIGETFLQKTGMMLLPDPYVLIHKHQRIVLCHGDLLCRKDKMHQLFRKLTQNKFSKKLFLNRPLPKRRAIALKARKASRGNKVADFDPVCSKYTSKLMHKKISTIMIHGHTHQANVHQHNDTYSFKRVVLGDWHSSAVIASLDCNCNLETVTLNL